MSATKTLGLCPSEISPFILRRLMGKKNRLKAERAWFLHERQRRAKPETEPLFLICGLLSGHKSEGVPRGYAPLVAGQELRACPRRGSRELKAERGERRKGESKAVTPPRCSLEKKRVF